MNKKQPEKLTEQIEYDNALYVIREAAIKVRLRQQYGVDPYKIPRQTFDNIRRIFDDIDKIEQTLNNKINALRVEAQGENQKLLQELNTITGVIHAIQNPVLSAPNVVPCEKPSEEIAQENKKAGVETTDKPPEPEKPAEQTAEFVAPEGESK
jgi:hypothetical protein